MEAETKTILIVDDDPDQIKLVEKALQNCGFDILTSLSAEEGLQLASRLKPDLILSDIMMPAIDGFEFLKRLGEIEELSNIPVLMLTAKNETADVLEAIHNGATDYIIKPIQKAVLHEKIQSALSCAADNSTASFPKGSKISTAQISTRTTLHFSPPS